MNSPALPSTDAPSPGHDDDLLISQPAFNRRIRWVGIGANLILAAVSLVERGDPWTAGVFAGMALLIALAEIWFTLDTRRRRAATWRSTVAAIITVATAVILLTGGVDSVLLVLFVPIAFTLGFSVPGGWVSLVPTAVVAVMVLSTVFTLPDGHSVDWSWQSGPTPARHGLLMPVMIAFFAALCSRLGRLARGSLIEARRSAERAQAERLREIAERHAGLIGLMGAVAHELKNPMTTVQSLTSHLHRKAPADSPLRERLGVVRGEVSRMRTTIDSLLNAARPLSTHVVGRQGLHDLAADVAASHAVLAHGRGIELVVGDGRAEATYDPRKMVQVVGNLMLNAVEACERGGRIEVDVGRADDGVWLEVRDDGPGVPEHIREVLCRPGVTTKPRGSGIGLALSQSIVQQHGGALSLADRPDGGCCARIVLPADGAEPGGSETPPGDG